MGPMVLFDKSFIEMVNVDEATIFDFMFCSNICPVFYVEVLADLDKPNTGARTPDKVVGDVSRKTPRVHSYPNVLHSTICFNELAGYPVALDRVPARAGGVPVRVDGKVGVYYDESPEMKAFNRWQAGDFREVERLFARDWRSALASVDLAGTAALAREQLAIRDDPKNESEAFSTAEEAISGTRNRYRSFRAALSLLGIPVKYRPMLLSRWKSAGGPPLREYAPYTAHCLLVDVFFHVAVAKRLIAPERISNRTDIAYLYYLPFAMIFVSNDGLHKRTVPLFLRRDQIFVSGDDLRRDLQELVKHFGALPPEILDQGLFAATRGHPPDDDRFLTARLWRQLGFQIQPAWPKDNDPTKSREVYERVRAMVDGMQREVGNPTNRVDPSEAADPDQVTIVRTVPFRQGRWQVMPSSVERKRGSR